MAFDDARDGATRRARMQVARAKYTHEAAQAYTAWSLKWREEAWSNGWSVWEMGPGFQLQKIDSPDEGRPEWDSDVIVWGIVWRTPSPLHAATLQFLKDYAPEEYEFMRKTLEE